jgi:protein phosphatase 4 regulatory subunit 3
LSRLQKRRRKSRSEHTKVVPTTGTDNSDRSVPGGPRRWGQGRLLEAEEEDWFNADDDDEEPFGVSVFNGQKNALKRKRPRGTSVPPIRPQQQSPLIRTPALGSLLEYDDGDDVAPTGTEEEASVNRSASVSPSQADIPASPRMVHRLIAIGKPIPDVPEDPEDKLLESLVSANGPPSPSLTKTPPAELGIGLKRRRDDEDEEMLERLASKAKKQTSGSSPGKDKPPASGVFVKLGTAKPAEEGKKIKLKLSSPSATPSPSSPGVKDGDTG